MSAVDELKINIDNLKNNIRDLATPGINVQDYFLTKRQTAKKIMLKSSPEGTTEEEVHLIVYGKLQYENGKLVDNETLNPECIDNEKAISEEHTFLKDTVEEYRNKVTNSYETLSSKFKEITSDSINLTLKSVFCSAEITAAAIPIVGTVTIPSAISSIITLLHTIDSIIRKITDILPFIDDLKYITYVVKEESIEIILTPINMFLVTINTTFKTINNIKNQITNLISFIGGEKNQSDIDKLKEKAIKDLKKDDDFKNKSETEQKIEIDKLNKQFDDMKNSMYKAVEDYKKSSVGRSDKNPNKNL